MSQAGVSNISAQTTVKFVSPTINFKQVAATTIFTNGSSNFIIDQIVFLADNVVNYSGGFIANVGFTAADYSDYLLNYTTSLQASSTYDIVDISGSEDVGVFPYLAAGAVLKCNVTTGAIADAFTGRVVITGFTV